MYHTKKYFFIIVLFSSLHISHAQEYTNSLTTSSLTISIPAPAPELSSSTLSVSDVSTVHITSTDTSTSDSTYASVQSPPPSPETFTITNTKNEMIMQSSNDAQYIPELYASTITTDASTSSSSVIDLTTSTNSNIADPSLANVVDSTLSTTDTTSTIVDTTIGVDSTLTNIDSTLTNIDSISSNTDVSSVDTTTNAETFILTNTKDSMIMQSSLETAYVPELYGNTDAITTTQDVTIVQKVESPPPIQRTKLWDIQSLLYITGPVIIDTSMNMEFNGNPTCDSSILQSTIAETLQVPIENIMLNTIGNCNTITTRKILASGSSIHLDFALIVGNQQQAQTIVDYLKTTKNQDTFVSTMTPLLTNIQGVSVTSATIRVFEPKTIVETSNDDAIIPLIVVNVISFVGPIVFACTMYLVTLCTRTKTFQSKYRR